MKTATSIGSLPSATNSYEFLFMTCYWLSGILVSAILIGQVRCNSSKFIKMNSIERGA
ncbi:unnamed protein product [Trichobilharzia regenti]|nr:unnamed protein product [Trichobilharzia regenti]